jgi:hypothetical protein
VRGSGARVVYIEARTFEDQSYWKYNATHVLPTGRAYIDGVVGNFLPGLKARTAGLAEIFIRWHGRATFLRYKSMRVPEDLMAPGCIISLSNIRLMLYTMIYPSAHVAETFPRAFCESGRSQRSQARPVQALVAHMLLVDTRQMPRPRHVRSWIVKPACRRRSVEVGSGVMR